MLVLIVLSFIILIGYSFFISYDYWELKRELKNQKNIQGSIKWEFVEGMTFEEYNPHGPDFNRVATIEVSDEYIPKFRISCIGVSNERMARDFGSVYLKLQERIKQLKKENEDGKSWE